LGGACSARGRDEKYRFLTLKGIDHFVNLGVERTIILKYMLK